VVDFDNGVLCAYCGRPLPCPEHGAVAPEGKPGQVRAEGPDGPYWMDPPGPQPDFAEQAKALVAELQTRQERGAKVNTIAAMASRFYAVALVDLFRQIPTDFTPQIVRRLREQAAGDAVDLWNRVNDGFPSTEEGAASGEKD